MWLLHKEQMDGCHIQHARNGREYRTPELAHYSVQTHEPSINFWDAIITDVNVNLLEM
jgi:hypothetical protein